MHQLGRSKVRQTMTHVSEINILKAKNVKITNLRAIIGTRTYAISDIASFTVDVNEPKLFIPVFFAVIAGVCSVLVAISDMREYSGCLTTGLYIGIAAVLLFILSQKTKYVIRIRSTSGEFKALETSDGTLVERIVRALDEAMIKSEEFT